MASSDVQRKLTAILSADVVGYSRLMGADEEATRRFRFQAIVDRLNVPIVAVGPGLAGGYRGEECAKRPRCHRSYTRMS